MRSKRNKKDGEVEGAQRGCKEEQVILFAITCLLVLVGKPKECKKIK